MTDDPQDFLEAVRTRLARASDYSYAELAAFYRQDVPRLLSMAERSRVAAQVISYINSHFRRPPIEPDPAWDCKEGCYLLGNLDTGHAIRRELERLLTEAGE